MPIDGKKARSIPPPLDLEQVRQYDAKLAQAKAQAEAQAQAQQVAKLRAEQEAQAARIESLDKIRTLAEQRATVRARLQKKNRPLK